MNQIPKVERWWRAWRDAQSNLQALSASLAQKPRFLSSLMNRESLPAQVVQPGALFYNLFPPNEAPPGYDRQFWMKLHIASCYRSEKVYWNIDPDLVESIADLPWPADTPATALLYLPNRAIVMEIKDVTLFICYDLATAREDGEESWPERGLELRINALDDAERDPAEWKWIPIGIIPILPGTLDEAADETFRRMDIGARSSEVHLSSDELVLMAEGPRQMLRQIVNVLLYAAGNDDVAKANDPWPSPPKKVLRRNDDRRFEQDIRQGDIFDVGTKYGAAIRSYRKESAGDATGGTVRPHMRAAHRHLYWTGEGRTIPKVIFLPPIAVRGAKPQEEADRITKRRVDDQPDTEE